MDTDQSDNLVVFINKTRRLMAKNQGWVMPSVALRVSDNLDQHEYRILVRGVEFSRDECLPNHLFVTGPPKEMAKLKGEEHKNQVYGVHGKWIDESVRAQADRNGLMTTDVLTFLSMMVLEAAFSNAYRLFTFEAFDEMLVALKKSNFGVVRHFKEDSELRCVAKRVFYNLLKERVPITDKTTILETIVHHRFDVSSPYYLTEIVRDELKVTLCRDYLDDDSRLSVIRLHEDFERQLEESITRTADGAYLTVALSS
jgi:flagellar biosynthesis protein FlhA